MLHKFDYGVSSLQCVAQCTMVRFAKFFSGGFITMAVINPLEGNWQNVPLCSVLSTSQVENPFALCIEEFPIGIFDTFLLTNSKWRHTQ